VPSKKLFLVSAILFVLARLFFVGSVEASLELWSRIYGGKNMDVGRSLVETSDGGYAIAGRTQSFGDGLSSFWLVKTDMYGNMEWNQTYGGKEHEEAYSLVETSDGGYAIAGGSLLVKTDKYGNMMWNQTYPVSAYVLVETSDGGYAIAGYTDSFGAGGYDFWLVKTDAQGIPEFPSWIILPLFLMATMSAIIVKKKLFHSTP
jgi:hypothetical protein